MPRKEGGLQYRRKIRSAAIANKGYSVKRRKPKEKGSSNANSKNVSGGAACTNHSTTDPTGKAISGSINKDNPSAPSYSGRKRRDTDPSNSGGSEKENCDCFSPIRNTE
jgi:hypothetical protein